MNVFELQEKFGRIGARVAIQPVGRLTSDGQPSPVRINIRSDGHGEYFHLMFDPQAVVSTEVLDIQPSNQHLLLLVRERQQGALDREIIKEKFLCGHDERAWFVAAIPEKAAASSVFSAMEALKPPAVREAIERNRVKRRDQNRRKNRAFVRQGEWFFIPRPELRVNPATVLQNEPLRRGNGKPHLAELCVRLGGESVYVSRSSPNGFTESEYKQWRDEHPTLVGKIRWTHMRRNARVYVRGRIRHPDHQTIVLQGWHEVQLNTETQSRAMRHVAFLD